MGSEPEPEPEPESELETQPELAEQRQGKLSKAEKKEQRKKARAAAKARARAAAAAALGDGSIPETKSSGKSHVMPKEMLEDLTMCGREVLPSEMPALERDHVQAVYDNVADQWDGTRYKAWPRVEAFIRRQTAGSLICDSGAGNGKNLPACDSVGIGIASDFSRPLLQLGLQKPPGHEGVVGDSTILPYREGCFDAALSIAVLHHLSTDARRELLVEQTMRVLRVGGEALFYAWALEQEDAPQIPSSAGNTPAAEKQAGRSGHRFDGKDVLVPFHLRVDSKSSTARRAGPNAGAARSTTQVAAHPLGLSPVHGAAAESLRAAKSQSAEAAALCETAEAAVRSTRLLRLQLVSHFSARRFLALAAMRPQLMSFYSNTSGHLDLNQFRVHGIFAYCSAVAHFAGW